jgi:hypothetical protein
MPATRGFIVREVSITKRNLCGVADASCVWPNPALDPDTPAKTINSQHQAAALHPPTRPAEQNLTPEKPTLSLTGN